MVSNGAMGLLNARLLIPYLDAVAMVPNEVAQLIILNWSFPMSLIGL